jgi:hypothetical protein
LEVLETNELPQLVLISGYSRIEISVLWARIKEANALLKIWTESVARVEKPNAVQEFALDLLNRNEFWPAAQLFHILCELQGLTIGARFDAESGESLALKGAQTLVCNIGTTTNSFALAHATWIASSVGTNQLSHLAETSRIKARELFSKLDQPTAAQRALARRIGLNLATKQSNADP